MHTYILIQIQCIPSLTKLSKGILVLIQSIVGETKHLNDFDIPQLTIKQDIFVYFYFVWDGKFFEM